MNALHATLLAGSLVLSRGLVFVQGDVRNPPPVELIALASKSGIDKPIVAWCPAEFQRGTRGAFAIAVASAARAGQYVALQPDGRATELGAFTEGADLACHSRERAERLNETIRQSETIEGGVKPRWNTTVVCGFTDATSATCWQYSPSQRAFVAVGRWVT